MKISVFKYKASETGITNDCGECVNTEVIESEINNFIKDKVLRDIKVNTFTTHQHNNGGDNEVFLVYTLTYEDK